MPPREKTYRIDPDSPDNALHPVEGNPSACAPPLCPECFRDGWPVVGGPVVTSVGCDHGVWLRQTAPDDNAGPPRAEED